MKNSGWTTFDPLFRGHVCSFWGEKGGAAPRTRCSVGHRLGQCSDMGAFSNRDTATGGRHVEVLKQATSPESELNEKMNNK